MFQVGDRVKCVDNTGYSHYFKNGDIYSVEQVGEWTSGPFIRINGLQVFAYRFEHDEAKVQTPSRDQILSAAKSSPEAEKVLWVLFPDVFPKFVRRDSLKIGECFSVAAGWASPTRAIHMAGGEDYCASRGVIFRNTCLKPNPQGTQERGYISSHTGDSLVEVVPFPYQENS